MYIFSCFYDIFCSGIGKMFYTFGMCNAETLFDFNFLSCMELFIIRRDLTCDIHTHLRLGFVPKYTDLLMNVPEL